MTDLNVVAWGAGEPVVLVHGSFGWSEMSWAGQRPLAERHQLLLFLERGSDQWAASFARSVASSR
jgi:hypothetical protein